MASIIPENYSLNVDINDQDILKIAAAVILAVVVWQVMRKM